jgi:hypothetical protein
MFWLFGLFLFKLIAPEMKLRFGFDSAKSVN